MSPAARRTAADPVRSRCPPCGRLHEVAERAAGLAGDRVVLRDPRRAVGGRELHWLVEMLAVELARLGLRPGRRVVVVGENGIALAVALLAASRCRAWAVPVNARLTRPELEAIVADAEPALLLFATDTSAEAAAHAAALGADTVELGRFGLAWCRGPGGVPARTGGCRRKVASPPYPPGTTGRARGVMLGHDALLFVAATTGRLRRLGTEDRVLGVLPLTHVFGLTSVFLASLLHGAELVLMPRFDAAAVVRALEEEGITVVMGVPMLYRRLLRQLEMRGRPLRAPRLRYASSGGAPLDPALAARVREAFGVVLHNGYGLTETGPTTHMTREDRPAVPGSVGPPLPGVAHRIVDPDGGRELPPGAEGEIEVRTPGAMLGYWRDPEGTARVLRPDGWLRTGDLGRIEADGQLVPVGRRRDVILRSGFNVHPAEVEAVLAAHPAVAAVAVLGLPRDDAAGEEEVVAVVEPVRDGPLDAEALARFAAARLAPYKRPSRWIVLPALPRTAAGKVRRAELRARLAEALRPPVSADHG